MPLSMLQKMNSSLKELKQFHAHMIKTAIDQYQYHVSKLIEASALTSIPSSFTYARELFSRIQNPNLFLYNTMIRGSLMSCRADESVSLYIQMRCEFLLPNNFTFPFVLSACEKLLELKIGEEIHGCVLRTGFGSDLHVLTTLLNMYSACAGSIQPATKVFEEMPHRDVVTWNSIISGHLRHGDLDSARSYFNHSPERNLVTWNSMVAGFANFGRIEEAEGIFREMPMKDITSWNSLISGYVKVGNMSSAERLFEGMPERDAVSWTVMINGYLKIGQCDNSLRLFHQMQLVKVRPNEVTLLSILIVCGNLGALELGRWVHGYIDKNEFLLDISLGTALIDMYAKCGDMDKGLEVFHRMGRKRDVIAWTTAIVGLAMNGKCREALEFFSWMLMEGIRPDEVTFLGVLCACSHGGFVEVGFRYFDSMKRDYCLVPRIEHYSCMVDLLGRAGLVEEAEEMVRTMPLEPDSVIWGSVFGACRVHKKVELGERVMKRLLEINPENKGNYVTISNIYAATGRWNDVAEMRKKLKEKGMRRIPGCSSIEVEYQVHEFVSGDNSHSSSIEIYEMLDLLAGRMKVEGYVPNEEFLVLEIE